MTQTTVFKPKQLNKPHGEMPAAPRKKSLLRRSLFPLGMLAAACGVFWLIAGHAFMRDDVENDPMRVPRATTDRLEHDPLHAAEAALQREARTLEKEWQPEEKASRRTDSGS